MTQRIALITGASSGIGKACATHLHHRGWRVFGTSRGAQLGQQAAEGFSLLPMDVTNDESVAKGVALLLEQTGRIDLVVNNAGFGIAGAVEDTTVEEARAQFETNLFGTWRVCRAVLPAMRSQHTGRIVTIGSLASRLALPYQGAYSASKAALVSLTEALRVELRPYGVYATLIELGDFRTDFANRRIETSTAKTSVYRERFKRALAITEEGEHNGAPPQRVAVALERIANARRPPVRYTLCTPVERGFIALKTIAPAWLYDLCMKLYFQQ